MNKNIKFSPEVQKAIEGAKIGAFTKKEVFDVFVQIVRPESTGRPFYIDHAMSDRKTGSGFETKLFEVDMFGQVVGVPDLERAIGFAVAHANTHGNGVDVVFINPWRDAGVDPIFDFWCTQKIERPEIPILTVYPSEVKAAMKGADVVTLHIHDRAVEIPIDHTMIDPAFSARMAATDFVIRVRAMTAALTSSELVVMKKWIKREMTNDPDNCFNPGAQINLIDDLELIKQEINDELDRRGIELMKVNFPDVMNRAETDAGTPAPEVVEVVGNCIVCDHLVTKGTSGGFVVPSGKCFCSDRCHSKHGDDLIAKDRKDKKFTVAFDPAWPIASRAVASPSDYLRQAIDAARIAEDQRMLKQASEARKNVQDARETTKDLSDQIDSLHYFFGPEGFNAPGSKANRIKKLIFDPTSAVRVELLEKAEKYLEFCFYESGIPKGKTDLAQAIVGFFIAQVDQYRPKHVAADDRPIMPAVDNTLGTAIDRITKSIKRLDRMIADVAGRDRVEITSTIDDHFRITSGRSGGVIKYTKGDGTPRTVEVAPAEKIERVEVVRSAASRFARGAGYFPHEFGELTEMMVDFYFVMTGGDMREIGQTVLSHLDDTGGDAGDDEADRDEIQIEPDFILAMDDALIGHADRGDWKAWAPETDQIGDELSTKSIKLIDACHTEDFEGMRRHAADLANYAEKAWTTAGRELAKVKIESPVVEPEKQTVDLPGGVTEIIEPKKPAENETIARCEACGGKCFPSSLIESGERVFCCPACHKAFEASDARRKHKAAVADVRRVEAEQTIESLKTNPFIGPDYIEQLKKEIEPVENARTCDYCHQPITGPAVMDATRDFCDRTCQTRANDPKDAPSVDARDAGK